MNPLNPSSRGEDIKVGFAPGNILKIAAGIYGDLESVIIEMIQNSLDAKSTRVWVRVDLQKKTLGYLDNGSGITPNRMRKVLSEVGTSQKSKNALGHFGIGIWAPLTVCDGWEITSCAPGKGAKFHSWVFDAQKIFAAATELYLPGERVREDLSGRMKARIQHRTEIKLSNITRDRHLSKISTESLEKKVHTAFNEIMRKQHATVELSIVDVQGTKLEPITISYRKVEGRRLPAHKVEYADCTTRFELLLVQPTSTGRYAGQVKFASAETPYPISYADLSKNASDMLSDIARKALRSKLFDGMVTGTSLELNASRKSFKVDAALLDFCFSINDWAEKVAKPLMDERERVEKDQRITRAGESALSRVMEMLRNELFKDKRQELEKYVRFGTQGIGHTVKGKEFGTQDVGSKRAKKSPSDEPKKGGKPTDNPVDRPGDLPGTVVSHEGERRTVVKHDSIGLQLSFWGTESGPLFELYLEEGRVNINTDHNLWATCEREERHMEALIEFVLVQVLGLLSEGKDWELYRGPMDEMQRLYVYSVILKAGGTERRLSSVA